MIIDQGTGAHQAQVQYLGPMVWTWVSGSGEAGIVVDGPYRVTSAQGHPPGASAAKGI
jgi:hypothetical protein